MMNIRQTLAALAAWTFTTLPAAADQISLKEISTYLNDMGTAKSGFTQISGDGTIMTGTLMIKRPWKIRFEYDQDDTLVISSARAVAIFDPRGNPRPETYPLGKTPLKLILGRNINLAQENMVVGQSYDGTATRVLAQDPKHPEYGTLELVFTDDPVQLRQWVTRDEAGSETTIVLGGMEQGVKLPNLLFNIDKETERRSK